MFQFSIWDLKICLMNYAKIREKGFSSLFEILSHGPIISFIYNKNVSVLYLRFLINYSTKIYSKDGKSFSSLFEILNGKKVSCRKVDNFSFQFSIWDFYFIWRSLIYTGLESFSSLFEILNGKKVSCRKVDNFSFQFSIWDFYFIWRSLIYTGLESFSSLFEIWYRSNVG